MNIEIIDKMIDDGIDICEPDNDKYTLLHYSVIEENIECVKKLINLNIDKSIKNCKGKTALDIAKKNKNKMIIDLLSITEKSDEFNENID